MKLKPETAEIYRRYAALFAEARSDLKVGQALKPKGWCVTSGIYPNEVEPQGAGIQVFRTGWFNENGNGVHFETWMKKSYHESGSLPFVLHVETGKARAGFGQKDFQKLFLERAGADLQQHGYSLNERYAMEPVKCCREFTPDSFVSVVTKEFRLLSRFGKTVDTIIEELTKAQ
ncbi:MAG: hypothetical protein EA425_17005 [Puniceicoccaceae bacterium]|nr:MAG: hypothetical protein EA425_17005 [Puniceicoccaceae bacterium]